MTTLCKAPKNKKMVLAVCFVFLAAFVCAAEFIPSVPSFVIPRYSAIGGIHTTDTTDYFTIFANPAGIPVASLNGKHAVWSGVYLNVGGPLDKALGLIGKSNIQQEIINLVDDNGASASFEMIGPIALGMLGKNFAWGIFNKTRVQAIIPSVSSMNAIGGEEILAKLSFGVPIIKTDKHIFSVGIGAKGIAKAEGLYKGSLLNIMNNPSRILETIPLYAAFGFGFDAGVYYRFNNILSAAVVWNDFYTPMWVQQYTPKTISSFGSAPSRYVVAPSKLNLGLGIKIPVGKADKVITDWNIMVDYSDFIGLFTQKSVFSRNPILNLSAGMEMVLLKFLALRVGLSDMYFNAGVGLKMGPFRIDFSLYGKELGLEPGSLPQMNAGFNLGFYY